MPTPKKHHRSDTTIFWRKVVKRRAARWLHGLVGAFISGGTTVGTTEGGLAIGHAISPTIQLLDFQQLFLVFVFSGFTGAVLYLRQSPLPSIERRLLEGDQEDRPIHPHVPGDPLQFISKPPEPPTK